jgi:predicted nicotinamide N-methyase
VLDELDLVEETVVLGERELTILRPRDGEVLLDDGEFERKDEYLPYWVELWPSGLALARAIHGRSLRGARVLELGCGLALPSVAAALAGGRVLATDWSAHAVAVAAENARRNGLEIDADVVSWYAPEQLVEQGPWDLVLAADVLYEARNIPVLEELLPRLVGDRGEVWLADPGRATAEPFFVRAPERWSVRTTYAAEPPHVAIRRLRPGEPLRLAGYRPVMDHR